MAKLPAAQVEYLCQKYEALQKQLVSVERNCAQQLQRQEKLQLELRQLRDVQRPQESPKTESLQTCFEVQKDSKEKTCPPHDVLEDMLVEDMFHAVWFSVRPYQDALAAELAARQASLVGLREAALSAKQEALCQSGRLREEQTAGQRAEQRCAQLAEECKQKSGRYDQVLQQLAQQDRDIAMHRFEAASTSRRVEQTQADSQVVREDLRVESQRHLLAQSELHDLEKALQAAVSQLRLFDQEAEHLQQVQAAKKHEVMEMDAEILSIQEMVSTVAPGKTSCGAKPGTCGRRLSEVGFPDAYGTAGPSSSPRGQWTAGGRNQGQSGLVWFHARHGNQGILMDFGGDSRSHV